ncbi:hypothetical protein Tsubulata_032473 [Turnera subulata]|uniref:non-specific serine/threonine protein kinase n=1 Tax=Turnera subulata TaxID=218843 RepID=A0A9Q0JGE2_9ROSI|nr:hypothetical protein Tsubulata_032473 [Turnera subulata]
MQENDLQGQIPEALSRLRSLGRFVLFDNNLTGQLPHGLYNISSIEIIDVHGNRLNGSIPSDIGLTLPRLFYLGLSNNSFTGLIPQTLSNASKLEQIDFADNHLRGSIPKDLWRLHQLQFLVFRGNQLEDDLSFINSLTNCSHLVAIDIQQNFFNDQIPKFIANLSLRGAIPIEIEYLTGLEFLILKHNFLSGPIHHINFTRLQRLERLTVEGNKLSGSIPSTIGNLGMLSFLGMSFNNFNGVIPPSLGSCRSLVALGLSHNNLGGSIPKKLFSLGSLSISLDLSFNRLTGSLPPEIGRLRNLGVLYVSDNKLVGIIPDSIAGCSSVEELYLDGNYFAGEIPHALSSLQGLKILDISRNNLSGQIPNFLSRLTLLNLSMNQLQGEVPKQGIFLNASAVSLFGNKDLCGGISQLKLPSCLNTERKKSNLHLIWKISIPIVIAVVLIFSVAFCIIQYGMGGKISKEGDMFTGKTPTDPRFTDDLHLHIFVQRALPHEVMEIVDQNILYERRNHAYTGCLLSLLTIGIQCSMTHPEDRMKIKDVLGELLKIKYSYGK